MTVPTGSGSGGTGCFHQEAPFSGTRGLERSLPGRRKRAEGLWINMKLILKHSVCTGVQRVLRQTDRWTNWSVGTDRHLSSLMFCYHLKLLVLREPLQNKSMFLTNAAQTLVLIDVMILVLKQPPPGRTRDGFKKQEHMIIFKYWSLKCGKHVFPPQTWRFVKTQNVQEENSCGSQIKASCQQLWFAWDLFVSGI